MSRENGILPFDKASEKVFYLLLVFTASFCTFGLLVEGPTHALNGMAKIIVSPGGLITDYIELAGIGAAFLNSGLVMLFTASVYKLSKLPFTGASIASFFMVGGFALFGKNIVNILPIVFGGFLFARYQKEPFAKYAYAVFFGTTLSPIVSFVVNLFNFSMPFSYLAAIALGTGLGFILPAVASHTVRAHQGYNLYNVGMAAGLIGLMLTALLRSAGVEFGSNLKWSEEYNFILSMFFSVLFALMLIIGFLENGRSLKGMKHLLKHSGRTVADYIMLEGLGRTLMNMGMLGFMAMGYILLIDGQLNGPTIGAIMSVVGFGAFGKHIKNVIPSVVGVVLASTVMLWELNEPSMQLAALFSTALSPIAGQFGVFWGLIAGVMHSAVVRDTAFLHGWVVLYNNGLSAGLICIVLVPIIETFRQADE